MTECQLIVDPPQPGSWNMAVDEWLLNRAADEGVMTLRLYQWRGATLSLGYFQAYDDRALHGPSVDCLVVRRASGGGALVHDRELTYSLAVPPGHALAKSTQQLYDAAHTSLIAVLTQIVQPVGAEFTRCRETDARGNGEPFLCFLRRAKGDVIYTSDPKSTTSKANLLVADGSFKICGSAQRKHRGAVLQHGGVLLAQSPQAPELPGVAELTGQGINAQQLGELWTSSVADQLGLELTKALPFSVGERKAIRAVETDKFGNDSWTRRR